jgi:molybdenum cofactor cytidylyltransferase
MNIKISHTAIVILAAGTSARLGSPKQLLLYRGKSLLCHAVDAALDTGGASVFVVLGAQINLFRKELNQKPVIVVENNEWEEGMAASIRCALESIKNTILRPENVIFMVCDQPHVSGNLLLGLLEKARETGMPIVASGYAGITGTPALFHKSLFPALMELKGDRGARKLMGDNPEKVAVVPFPEGITDIDTMADYELLNTDEE